MTGGCGNIADSRVRMIGGRGTTHTDKNAAYRKWNAQAERLRVKKETAYLKDPPNSYAQLLAFMHQHWVVGDFGALHEFFDL